MNLVIRAVCIAAVMSAASAAVPATGQAPDTTVTSTVTITPKRAGTEARPQGVRLRGRFALSVPEGTTRPRVLHVSLRLPRGIRIRSARYPTCARRVLDRRGPEGCPKASIVGSGVGTLPEGDGRPHPKVTLINGGPRRIWAYAVYRHPVLIREAVEIEIRRRPHGKWAYELDLHPGFGLIIPEGDPEQPSTFRFAIGGTPTARNYLETYLGCPRRGFMPFSAVTDLVGVDDEAGTATAAARIACR